MRIRPVEALAYLCAVIAVLPMVLVVITRWGSDYFPVQDLAVIDLRVRDVLTSHSPLVGAYSQFRWNHPGPVLYWMLTPFMLISRGNAWGLIIGSAVIQGCVTAATVLVAKRSAGSLWAIAWAVVVTLAYVPTGPWILFEAWNPHLAYPFFTLFVLLVWRCATVPGSYLPWVTLVSSILVQLHVGYVPLVGVAFVWLAWIIWREARTDSDFSVRKPLIYSALMLVLLWWAPLVEALMHRGGNIRALASYFLLGRGQESRAGLGTGVRVIASVFRIPPAWLGGSSDLDTATGHTVGANLIWAAIPIALIIVGVVIYRRCDRRYKNLLVLSWLMLGTGLLSLTLLRGKVAPYLFYWRNVIAIVTVLAVVASLYSIWPRSRDRTTLRVGVAFLGAISVAVPSVTMSVGVLRAPDSVMGFESATRDLSGQITHVDGPVIVRWIGSPLGGLQAGVIADLDRRGFPVGVDQGEGFQWGYQREVSLSDAKQVWFVSEGEVPAANLETLPGARVIARVSPLDASDDAELSDLQAEAAKQLEALGRHDIVRQLDSSLAYFNLEKVGVLTASERQRFLDLSEKVESSGGVRAAIVGFKPSQVPDDEVIESLR